MRNASTLVRLLLFVVLAVATAGMHTVGHPPETGRDTAPAGAHAAMADTATVAAAADGRAADDCPEGHCSPAPVKHDGGMDPASVCLAIALAAFALTVALLAVRRGLPRRTALFVRGLWGRVTAALPPPRPPALSQLAILRI